jgi:hypothetical protein
VVNNPRDLDNEGSEHLHKAQKMLAWKNAGRISLNVQNAVTFHIVAINTESSVLKYWN